MRSDKPSQTALRRVARSLRERDLADIALPLLDILRLWGFVGGQLLWMLAPFLGGERLSLAAQVLEEPDMLQQLQLYLLDEEECEA